MPDTTGLSKYIIAFVAFFMALGQTFAQKEPQYTQYMYNIGSFNPAYSQQWSKLGLKWV